MKTGLFRNTKLAGGLGLLLALTLIISMAMPVMADDPPSTMWFLGSATKCGTPVPDGTPVEAKILGVTVATDYVASGLYGQGTWAVPGNDGDTVELWMMGQMLYTGPYQPLTPVTANLVAQPELTTASTAGGSVTTPGEAGPYQYTCGQQVTIVATADPCYEFTGWTGDTVDIADTGAASTTITMNDDYSITANFALKQVDLTTASTAGGSVTTPGEAGPYTYDCGQQVTIVATASGCYNFTGWTGDTGTIADTGAASTTITMNDDYSITANFELASELVDVEIPFNLGWNTFSTPISLHECVNTWDEFIAANNLTIEMIYGYDSASESWVPVNGGDEIEPLYGFYVKTLQAGVAHIIPNNNETSPPTRELSSGVHLIGPAPASLGDVDVVSALTTIYWAEGAAGFQPTGYTLVVSPYVNSSSWSYVRDATPIPNMSIGRAYWTVMDNADLYVGETTTPLVP